MLFSLEIPDVFLDFIKFTIEKADSPTKLLRTYFKCFQKLIGYQFLKI